MGGVNRFTRQDAFSLSSLKLAMSSENDVFDHDNNEPGHSIPYKNACAPSEVSDKPAQMRRLIRVFAVRLKILRILSYHPCEDSDQTAQMRRLIWVYAGRTCNL